jgi:hypothetical protein
MPGFLQLIPPLYLSQSRRRTLISYGEYKANLSYMCPKREIHSRDPFLLILIVNNELGFQGMPPPGARGLAYIAL